ncbi:6-phosphogluconate dehydrogenase [Croceimicrobium hydrocarbonivorans]|uniref:6-phosphogluconate dehydrogenase n=1 Tax=Croceimicrobium hydrocarbonivorans TaxID=2761580 RepID=A0A7H0VI59_9FLAO|nr:6-phosphogluconate dehydrogenase [Croceimicrobium hydrocarbonivorans]QNR25407.1 6-phosphogluconate dehydrogenase [Croceimicrobium hydrocarbonivorans]
MRKTLFWILGIALILLIGWITFLYYGTYSEGVRAGTVIKLSRKGVVFKTWEGQLNIRSFGAVNSNNSLSETFEFSIESDQEHIIKTLEEVSLSGERVNLHYIERYRVLPWRGSTRYFITKIERSPQKKPASEEDAERAPFK